MNGTDFREAAWRTSSYSGDSGNCVEVATNRHQVGVRDTKRRDAGTLVFTSAAWSRFVSSFSSRGV